MPNKREPKSKNKLLDSNIESISHKTAGWRKIVHVLINKLMQFLSTLRNLVMKPINRLMDLRSRRAHKSFVRTRRRDYVRPLEIPGYISFTVETFKIFSKNKKLFIWLSILATVMILLLGGLSSQQLYRSVSDSITGEASDASLPVQVGTLVLSSVGLMANGTGEAQQVYLGLIGLLVWLTTVWLLREIIAGQKPMLRDGLYSAGSPIVSTLIVVVLLLAQLLPILAIAIIYGALSATGLISEGLGAFLFFGAAALIVTLTLYWITSTLLALVIITLPGMYPWRAMRAASDMVVGRRLRMFYRILWLALQLIIAWAAVLGPVVLLNIWLNEKIDWFSNIPLVPIVSVWLTMILVIWASTYIYMLYRKVVASDARSSN